MNWTLQGCMYSVKPRLLLILMPLKQIIKVESWLTVRKYFFIVYIYAQHLLLRNESIKTSSESLVKQMDTSRLIIANHWNCTLTKAYKSGGISWKSQIAAAVDNLMIKLHLIDVYWKLILKTWSFTYESKTITLKSRIHFILVSISIKVQNAAIQMSAESDHEANGLFKI